MRALQNWRIVSFRLSLVKIFGGLEHLKQRADEEQPTSKKKQKYIKPWYIISHVSKYKIAWDLIWAVILLVSYFLSFYTIAFDGDPL